MKVLFLSCFVLFLGCTKKQVVVEKQVSGPEVKLEKAIEVIQGDPELSLTKLNSFSEELSKELKEKYPEESYSLYRVNYKNLREFTYWIKAKLTVHHDCNRMKCVFSVGSDEYRTADAIYNLLSYGKKPSCMRTKKGCDRSKSYDSLDLLESIKEQFKTIEPSGSVNFLVPIEAEFKVELKGKD